MEPVIQSQISKRVISTLIYSNKFFILAENKDQNLPDISNMSLFLADLDNPTGFKVIKTGFRGYSNLVQRTLDGLIFMGDSEELLHEYSLFLFSADTQKINVLAKCNNSHINDISSK